MKASGLTPEQFSLAELAQKAASRSHVFNAAIPEEDSFSGTYQGDAALMGKKDNSRKAYYREFKKVSEVPF
jgi:nuclear GTP-binding protein